MLSLYYTRCGVYTSSLSYRRCDYSQACEKQEKCRDAARALVDELDDFLQPGYEELEPELKERKETRETIIKIANLIKDICDYIIKNNKNMFRTFFRTSVTSII